MSPPEIPTCGVSDSAWAPLSPLTSEAQHGIHPQNQLLAADMEQQAPKGQLKTAKLMMPEVQAEAKQTHGARSLSQSQGAVSTGRKQDKGFENKNNFAVYMPDNSPDILRLENILFEEQEKNKQLRVEVDRLRNENIVAERNVRMLRRELERKQQEMDNILLPQLDTAVVMIRDIEQKHQCEREEKRQQVDILAAQLAAALDMIQNSGDGNREVGSSSQ
ncbi:hypothetical protein F4776DRAFT_630737 [Hypoxylon sp. NC0597]|nr:hypothetical protein F4776DRAFT_630737 [Hypoxylon sp. NC0597]